MSFGQLNEGERDLEEKYNELRDKYETALAMGKDWKEKLQEVIAKQKENIARENGLREENEQLTAENLQLKKQMVEMAEMHNNSVTEFTVFGFVTARGRALIMMI
eukprot:TRINITY_DN12615_c0_g1_i2.p2 TRINITY_DN12615_c0_g1~~TRINITY_DN12615_c0_g1_i2.p2  ORF type:complete len:105 (-),score=29.22 TRINITY_DN12615_c0_g1_i2:315-629(-)